MGKHQELARILDLQVERVVADPAQQAEYLRQLARLGEGPLRDLPRARQSWEQLSDLLPSDAEALEALARIYTAEEDWTTLVRRSSSARSRWPRSRGAPSSWACCAPRSSTTS